MKDVKYDYSGLQSLVYALIIFIAVVFGIGFYRAEKNVPKNIPVKNEWFCIPSPQLQKQADDALLNMEVMVCARDKPSKR